MEDWRRGFDDRFGGLEKDIDDRFVGLEKVVAGIHDLLTQVHLILTPDPSRFRDDDDEEDIDRQDSGEGEDDEDRDDDGDSNEQGVHGESYDIGEDAPEEFDEENGGDDSAGNQLLAEAVTAH